MLYRILFGLIALPVGFIALDAAVAAVRLRSTGIEEPYFGFDDHGGRQDIWYPSW